jgi:hypothetical protein
MVSGRRFALPCGGGESAMGQILVVFEIFHEPSGLWRIRRSDGLVEGRFRDRRTAIRFARHQYPGDGVMIVFDGEKKPQPSGALAIAG